MHTYIRNIYIYNVHLIIRAFCDLKQRSITIILKEPR